MVSNCTTVCGGLRRRVGIENFHGSVEPRRRELDVEGVDRELEDGSAARGTRVAAARHEAVAEATKQLVMHRCEGEEMAVEEAQADARRDARSGLDARSSEGRRDGTTPRCAAARLPTVEARGA